MLLKIIFQIFSTMLLRKRFLEYFNKWAKYVQMFNKWAKYVQMFNKWAKSWENIFSQNLKEFFFKDRELKVMLNGTKNLCFR